MREFRFFSGVQFVLCALTLCLAMAAFKKPAAEEGNGEPLRAKLDSAAIERECARADSLTRENAAFYDYVRRLPAEKRKHVSDSLRGILDACPDTIVVDSSLHEAWKDYLFYEYGTCVLDLSDTMKRTMATLRQIEKEYEERVEAFKKGLEIRPLRVSLE